MNYTVVVDGGGSGCRLGAFDANGNLCETSTDGPASLTLGEQQAWEHINSGIKKLAEKLGCNENWLPSNLHLGLAGALQETRRENFLSLIPEVVNTLIVTDGHAQLEGATAGRPGICLAVGTGSVMHWRNESGSVDMVGGWGFPIGDEASGAWLGAHLINAYLWHRDTRHSDIASSSVFPALEARIGSTVADVQAWSTNTRSTELASLAPMIISAAEHGDTLANALLDRGADYCKRLINLAPDTLPIHVVGGLSTVYRSRFCPTINDRCEPPHGDVFSGLYALTEKNLM